VTVINADVLDGLRGLQDGTVRCCVTSPPYWGLRDYGHEGQIGLERTPEEYVGKMVEVFRGVRRVMADDGTLWAGTGGDGRLIRLRPGQAEEVAHDPAESNVFAIAVANEK